MDVDQSLIEQGVTIVGVIQDEQFKSKQKNSVLLVEEVKTIEFIIDGKKDNNQYQNTSLKQSLIDLNYNVIHCVSNSALLSKQCLQHLPDILIINTNEPSAEILKEISNINKLTPLPVLVFATQETPSLIKSSIQAGVSAYIVNDIQPSRLNSLITVACERFKEHQLLVQELQRTKNQLADRKIVERAKGYIMQQRKMTEQEAFTLLRKMAMNNGQTLAEVSNNIITVFTH
ncbi:ANTAR domain-containing protein [Psychromonas sp. SP041]|uniref:ANTAR domain-containing response regulator n=1 Tax=Psychromonas sp. SP041 TaxID=1365007 RepID=UPI00046F02B0|nr:ANTAR domain-containing protein [Psychromonas sp. SP041]